MVAPAARLAIVTGIIGAIAGLLAITIDWLIVRRETASTTTRTHQ
jgi:hypothetical protein